MTQLKVPTLVLAIVIAHIVSAQSPKISAELLKGDLQLLKTKLESSQPGLYLYTSKDSLNKIFGRISDEIKEPLTSIEFYRRIAPLNRILRNLHTRLWPSAEDEKATENDQLRFPLDIYWRDNKMYVLRNHSAEKKILPGAVVTAINGESAASVFQKILDCRVRDGYNESYPIAQASRNFSFYYAQLIGTPKVFNLELTVENGSAINVELQAVTVPIIRESRNATCEYSQYSEDWDLWVGKKEPALKFEIKERVGIMKVHTFYTPIIEENGQNYQEFFKKAFDQIISKQIKFLVIDLRNNHGGSDPVGMELMSHLHDSTFYYYKKRTMLTKPKAKSIKRGDHYEIIGRGVWTGKVVPAKNIFKGKVYVLMNGYSVSAAGEFIGHLKNIKRATFIGEEAGGNPVIFTGGNSLPIDLPNSHITGTIPLQLVEMNVRLENTGRGVRPDYEVQPTINDILSGRDVERELAWELIRNDREK